MNEKNTIPVLRAAKEAVEEWLWEHHGDAFDAYLQWRHRMVQRLRDYSCWLTGHRVEYIGPGPWDWDGEPHAYCERCEGERLYQEAVARLDRIESAFHAGEKVLIDAEVIESGNVPLRVRVRIAGHDNSGYVMESVVHRPTRSAVRGPLTRAQIAKFADLWYQRNGGYTQPEEPFKIVEGDIAEITHCLRAVGVEVES